MLKRLASSFKLMGKENLELDQLSLPQALLSGNDFNELLPATALGPGAQLPCLPLFPPHPGDICLPKLRR